VHRFRLPLLLLVLLSALAFAPGAARPSATAIELTASTGPGFNISLKDANGVGVTHLDPGDYTITVHNLSDPPNNGGVSHNFHLKGPGVNQATTFANGTTVWNVTLTDGTYTYVCDAHPTIMKGSFTVGNLPPPPVKLSGKVGPARTITLKKGSSLVKSLKAGKYKIVVNDASAKDNFHLKGPGVSKKTSVPKRSKATWKVTLRKGKYTYFSDAHKSLKRSFSVK
jgi:hypothetical protein